MNLRTLGSEEQALIEHMLHEVSQENRFRDLISNCLVEDLSNGGMGSTRFDSQNRGERRLGEDLCQSEFLDFDGVPILATLSLDNFGQLFELDLWKVDFSPILQFPLVH
jgi:hypothetical protein